MMLSKENPYANGRIIEFSDNTAELDRDFITLPKDIPFKTHLVKEGEWLDDICYIYYQQAERPEFYSLVLADINDIDFPLDQESYEGRSIIIPDFAFLEML
ncbi:MAG: hypothetical protein OHK0045_22870 [Raineya sp.]